MKIFLYEKLNGFLNKHLFKLLRPAYFIMGCRYGVWEILLRGLDAEAKSGSNALLMYNLVNIMKKVIFNKIEMLLENISYASWYACLKSFRKIFYSHKKLAHVGKSMLHTYNFIKHGQMHCQEY